VLDSIAAANTGHAFGYGDDEWTQRVERRFREHFGAEARAYLVWGGTAANVLSLRASCRPWEAAICADSAHMNVDEAGAPESIAGVKLLAVASEHGKLTPGLVERAVVGLGDEHAVQPRVVSISQATELGTVYSLDEIRALAELVHGRDLLLHVDGARLSNASAALGEPLRALSTDAGVDVLSFGGTKNGLLGAEAVVFLSDQLGDGFRYLRKQSLHLASKMRFLAAQFDALLRDDLWLELASSANAMAARLADAVSGLPGVTITHPVQSNAVFARLPEGAIAPLLAQFQFYVWDERTAEVRWMCSWDTSKDDVDALARSVKELSVASSASGGGRRTPPPTGCRPRTEAAGER
jgi:threonine aldolase